MLSFEWISFIGVVLIVFSVFIYLKKNDEFPLVLSLFNYSICVSRFKLIQAGVIKYVQVNYQISLFDMNDEGAIISMNYILLGTVSLMFFYLIFSSSYEKKEIIPFDSKEKLSIFLQKNQLKLIVGFILFLMLSIVMRGNISGSLALGNGYFFLFGLAVGGFNLLIALILISGRLNSSQKYILVICLLIGIIKSYNPTTRFQFLSWAIGVTFILFQDMKPSKKLKYIIPIGICAMLFFSLLGADRHADVKSLSFKENLDLAIERTMTNEDQNMLDGFMMILDVYPEHLDFSWGMEHLEILMRPVPRSWWPEKPLGGYANKLGLNNIEEHGTVGISQTLYGSFYEEGGVIGIIIFSIIYAKLFAWLLFLARKYNSDLRFLIKGVIIASLIPLIRGGDLPGIYAFIGMSFWPVFIFLRLYNKYLFIENKIDSVSNQQTFNEL